MMAITTKSSTSVKARLVQFRPLNVLLFILRLLHGDICGAGPRRLARSAAAALPL
jgi:hypothetical protein